MHPKKGQKKMTVKNGNSRSATYFVYDATLVITQCMEYKSLDGN